MANYLYNGVELPEIPEVAGYQYLMIFEFDTRYALYAYKRNKYAGAPFYRRTSPAHEESFYFPGTYKYFLLRDGIWVQTVSETSDSQNTVYSDRYKNPIWTNFTFKYTTVSTQETLVLCEASEPVPVLSIDHTAMLQGWIVGKRLAAMRGKKEPVAYLYNGVRLPQLPEWDKETYPYAFISESYTFEPINLGGITQLCFASKPCVFNAKDIRLWPVDGTTVSFMKYSLDRYKDSEWKIGMGLDDNPAINVYRTPVWSNYTVNDPDGNLVLAASEPVPVYE